MPLIPPPLPLSSEEFKKRYKPDMSLFEVDPEYAKWYRNNKKTQLLQAIVIAIGTVVLGLILVVIACSK